MKIRSIPPHLSSQIRESSGNEFTPVNATFQPLAQLEDGKATFGLRKYYGRIGKGTVLCVKRSTFSILTQNMALVVFPGKYQGGNSRQDALDEIVAQIRQLSPDVVGLCEVYSDGERESIWNAVKNMYPFAQGGPDESDLDSDGGLLLMSKHPFLQTEQIVYSVSRGNDAMANKGVIYVRIQPPSHLHPIDLFYTHAQDLDATRNLLNMMGNPPLTLEELMLGANANREILKAQLAELKALVARKHTHLVPAFIFGDLNFHGDDLSMWQEMLSMMDYPADLWVAAGNQPQSGLTNVRDNNFYGNLLVEDDLREDLTFEDRKPKADHRLDFILMHAHPQYIPIVREMNVMKFMKNGRNLSDHFGLYVRFEEFLHGNIF